MFIIYNQSEWSEILKNFSKPNDLVKEDIWEKTRCYDIPLVNITQTDASDDFQKLQNLDTSTLIKKDNLFSRYEYKWDLGDLYIDSCNIGNKSSNFFHQDLRFKCDSINSPSPYRTWNDKKFFMTLLNGLWSLKIKEVTSETLRTCIALRKYIASQFRPSAAKALYDHFKAENVLDFSSGWGDRLSGAMASKTIKSYTGIDPNKDLVENYQKQIDLFGSSKKINMIQQPAEDAIKTLDAEFDLIFTSPPYFIIERYSKDSTQSWQRYKKIDKWLNGFLFPVLENSWKLLKTGGHISINISDVYCNHTINKICDPMNDFINGLTSSTKIDNLNYRMMKRTNSKSDRDGIFVEPNWIWKKN
jgi:tRNA1(Val) A37 N6-methylase TrmN6